MPIKQSREQQQPKAEMKPLKRLCHEDQQPELNATMTDRLSALPEDLQLRILSSLETKHAFQTSLLSKAWLSKWTQLPALKFTTCSFNNKVCIFDKFVFDALSVPRSAPLVELKFRRFGVGACSEKMLNKVFDYAFKQRVEILEVDICRTRNNTSWPMIMSSTSTDSLISLKLKNYIMYIGCSYLGPRSGSFKNLASLHLQKAIITDLDPFSGFPALKKLKLIFCRLEPYGNSLNIHAKSLLELTIAYHGVQCVNGCNITTPNLKYFEFQGTNFPRFEITHHLPDLETAIIDYNGFCEISQEKKLFDDVMILFKVLCNVKSLTVYSSIVRILSLFPDELANSCSPFWDLKSLKVDLNLFYRQKLYKGNRRSLSEALIRVKGYLLQKSPDAKYTMIDPIAPKLKPT